MRKILVVLLMLTFASCQKEIETQEQFLARTNQSPLRMQDGDKLAVTVDMQFKPHTTYAYINRYDSVNGQQILADRDSFVIQPGSQHWTRNFKYTTFPYKGRIQVIVRDSLNIGPYEKWMTLTNADGTVISYDTCAYAKSGWVGLCKVIDAVPKHYQ